MNIPLFCFTDASYEYGNNTIKENIQCAKENGFNRVGVIDKKSLSGAIRFIDNCKKENVSSIIGVTLPVSLPERDRLLWFLKNEVKYKLLCDELKIKTQDKVHAYEHCKMLCELIVKAHKSKAKGKLNTFFDNIKEFGSKLESQIDLEQLKLLNERTKSIDFTLTLGELIFISKNNIGYKKIIELTSVQATKKHHCIENGLTVENIDLTSEDIDKHKDSVFIVDGNSKNSVLGALAEIDPNVIGELDLESLPFDAIGVDYPLNKTAQQVLEQSDGKQLVPLLTTHYTRKELYLAYCVKVAVHQKNSIYDLNYQAPEQEKYIHSIIDIERYFSEINQQFDVDIDFWNGVSDTDVPINQIHLPKYEMPVLDIINYALTLNNKDHQPFVIEKEAIEAFDNYILPNKKETQSIDVYRQQRLNDFCLHYIAYHGIVDRLKGKSIDNYEETLSLYMSRFMMEYDVIERMGFSGYFLIEYDFTNQGRKMRVPIGDGRGSAAGSLIVYGMGITDVDPIEYGLQFERFLNPERVSMPDIDVDFGQSAFNGNDRLSVIDYIAHKHQQKDSIYPSVSQISNINTYQLKSSISSVRKALGFSMFYDGYLKKIISDVEKSLGISNPDSVSWDQLMDHEIVVKKTRQEPNLKLVLSLAKELTNKQSTYGVHAGGLVISPTVITDYSAIECDDKGKYFSQFDKNDIELAGLVKFDILGLRTLSIVDECLRQIKKNKNIDVDIRNIDMKDEKVFDLICRGHLTDIFQLESPGMRGLVNSLQPKNIDEIAVLSALFRPGALQSGMVEEFESVKFQGKKAKYDHKALEPVLEDTLGCIVFQEQVMSIVRVLAGYSLGEADILRRAMGKKKLSEMLLQKNVYIKRALNHWRNDNIENCKKMMLNYDMDVCFKDRFDIFEKLGLAKFLDEDGFISSLENNIDLMVMLLGLNDIGVTTLKQRISDHSYVVKLFKKDYQLSIYNSIEALMIDLPKPLIDEIKTRIYFSLTQFVRFNQIFNKIEKFAGYGFNKSHAISYAIITYKAAYLKTYYPQEFYSASLSFKKLELLSNTKQEMANVFGINLLSPDINKSEVNFSVENNKNIRYGLAKLRELVNASVEIVKNREENGLYVSFYDFVSRLSVKSGVLNVGVIHSLSVSGAFDQFIPKIIKDNANINGRSFFVWLYELIKDKDLDKELKASNDQSFHNISDLNEFEFFVYLTASIKDNYLVKNELLSKIDLTAIKKLKNKDIIEYFLVNKEFLASNSLLSKLLAIKYHTCFEQRFLALYRYFLTKVEFSDIWNHFLKKMIGQPIVNTLNEEYHVAGVYLTSNPLKVLKISSLVEKEPPSSVITGFPISVDKVDESFDGVDITTYGIVRNVVIKAVKKEDSPNYKQKMLFFDLEDGSNLLNCMIFGTQNVTKVEKNFIDGSIVMVGGKVKFDNYGLTVSVKALKNFYPTEDKKITVIQY